MEKEPQDGVPLMHYVEDGYLVRAPECEPQSQVHRRSKHNKRLLILTTVFTLIVFVSNAGLYGLLRSPSVRKAGDYYLQNPIQKYESDVPRTIQFLTNGFFEDNLTMSDDLWRTMFPVGEGVVVLPDDKVASMGLTQSVRTPDGSQSVYLMSAFHHMHCVSLLRYVLYKYRDIKGFTLDDDAWHHTWHCVDTLREHIVCHPDSTLLGRLPGKEAGVGQSRVCKNFDAYKEWARTHSYGYVGDFP